MELLKVKNLEKKYGNIKAVNDISFAVEKGEILGLLGPNGAGKSTAISMISTLFQPDNGDILFKGTSIIKKPRQIQEKLGMVPQDIALYQNMNGYENLKFWGQAYGLKGKVLKDRITQVSEIISISDRLKDKVKTYSGGMKRRLNIGVGLLHEPELLIMDEPTVGIDPQSRNHILDTVKKLNQQGLTIIYTSHYMEEVEYLCRKVEIMDEGKIIASGSKEELVEIINGQKKVKISFDVIIPELVAAVKEISYVSNLRQDGETLFFSTTNGENLIEDIIMKTKNLNIKITALDIEKPNLESVFLYLTGKELRD